MPKSPSKSIKHPCFKLKVDDEVIVLSGKDKGKRGKIMAINRDRNILVVQGINLIRRFQRPSQENPKGGILELERPLHFSNVAYYDSKSKKGMRLGYLLKGPKQKRRAFREKGQLREIKESLKSSA